MRYADIYEVVVELRKRKVPVDTWLAQMFEDDLRSLFLGLCLWVQMECGQKDRTMLISNISGTSSKSIETWWLKENKKEGNFVRYRESTVVGQQAYKGTQKPTILKDDTRYKGSWTPRGCKSKVASSAIFTPSNIVLKILFE